MTINKLKIVSSTMLIASAILHSSIAYADDSEVFFGSEQFANVAKPNIIFLLDYSTSMNSSMPSSTGVTGKRIDGLRDAVAETLLNTSLQGVRVGVMRYPHVRVGSDTSVGTGAKLVYPVVDIDAIDGGDILETNARATSGKDDAHQTRINGLTKSVSVDSNVMLMGNLSVSGSFNKTISLNGQRNNIFTLVRSGSNDNDNTSSNAMAYTCSMIVEDDAENCVKSHLLSTGTSGANHVLSNEVIDGETKQVIAGLNATTSSGDAGTALFIFKDANIPATANISSATLTLTAERDAFRRSNGSSICGTTSYPARMRWRVATARNFPMPADDTLIYSHDGKTSSFNFYITGGGTTANSNYEFYQSRAGYPSENADKCYFKKGNQFKLDVTTAVKEALSKGTSAAAQSGAPMADIAIRFMIDYYDETVSRPMETTGINAPKLEVNYTANQTNSSSNAGVRFNDVYIPQGATVTSAKIKLVPAGGDNQSVTLKITGEKTGDAKEFSATSGDFTTRARTTANQNWNITSPWETNTGDDPTTRYVETPDISNILNEIVQTQEWCGGQSVALFLDYQSGNGYRSAFTYDENTSLRPVLEFTYTGGATGCMTKTWEEALASRTADGYQTSSSNNTPNLTSNYLHLASNYKGAAYFSNVLLRNPNDEKAQTAGLTDKGLVNATLTLVPYDNNSGSIQISLDNAVNAERLKAAKNNIGSRTLFNVAGGDDSIANVTSCTIPKNSKDQKISCDVTNLIREKIQQNGWENGNGLVFILQRKSSTVNIKTYETGFANSLKLKITARQELMAPNSLTVRRRIVNAVNAEEATVAQTPTMPAMLDAARYISNYPSTNAPTGPYQGTFYWNGQAQPSPLLSSCQATHLVLMSDGNANYNSTNWRKALVSYTGRSRDKSTTVCEYNNRADGSSSEMCGQALVNFMSTTSQGLNDDDRENWVTTHAVAFGSRSAGEFLQRLVNANDPANKGYYFYAETSDDLVSAFMDIMDTAKGTFYNYTSGQVAISNENRYIQRREIYYSLMEPSNRNHWSGNMKRFGLIYTPTTVTIRNDDGTTSTTSGERAILVDAYGEAAVFKSSDGYYFISPQTTSWWHTAANQEDGGDVHKGGVLDMLADNPDNRAMYVMKGNTRINFSASNVDATGATKITPDDMEVVTEESEDLVKLTKGYVNFLRGFAFNREGEASEDTITDKASLRLGDFAHSAVTFVNYGACITQPGYNPISCDASFQVDDEGNEIINYADTKFLGTGLEQIALLAGNDGFFRAFDVRTGEQLYAVIPNEMLPIIPELQERKTIGLDVPRLYGLDGTVHIYHDDVDGDGYVNGEQAIAYVSAGRGGRALFAIDISSKASPTLLWKIEGNKGDQFNDLGYTWSTPVTGKMRIGSAVRKVVIFGGGYDPNQDEITERAEDNMGNEIYILDAVTGSIIWKAGQSTYGNMKYSIPSSVTTLEREIDGEGNRLITDIFVGDMGGQLWRFNISNGVISAVGENGVIARVGASGDKAQAQRIYMAPAVYEFADAANKGKLSVNVGTGYLGHPLVTYNKDKFYSFRFNVTPTDSDNKALTEASMVEVTAATISDEGKTISTETAFTEYGFYVTFGAADPNGITGNGLGEKMISSMSAARNITNSGREEASVFFNTYVPNPNSGSTCRLASGWQRAYGFNIVTGESYFGDSLFRSSVIIGIPPGVNTYCEGHWCTPVWNYEDLAIGDGSGGAFQWNEKDGEEEPPPPVTPVYKKMGWTDLFDPQI